MKLLWIDLETTGLDAQKHHILEVCCALAPFEDPFNVEGFRTWQRRYTLSSGVEQGVIDTHTKNGLWTDCQEAPLELHEIEDQILALLPPPSEDIDERPILAGSTVHFDMGFIKKHMRRLAARLSYRLFDMRTTALFCWSMGMPKIEKKGAHRAFEDVQESIELGRACKSWLERRAQQEKPIMCAADGIDCPNLGTVSAGRDGFLCSEHARTMVP